MLEAAGAAALIAPRGVPPPAPARLEATARGAVDLASVAATADQDLLTTEGTEEETAVCVAVQVASDHDVAANPWTRYASGAIMPLQSCSGTVWGAAPNLNCQVHRSAPRLVQQSARL